ncbi:MAG: hypothetical protein NXH82_03610 [Rhodobacteraceae bacterium]|nr:hypothetical protein [Paracoccaceae bacterium]
MKLAFVTMVWRDHDLLARWVAHNSGFVPRGQLYVLNHGGDEAVRRIAAGCNVIDVPRDDLPIDLTRRRWDLLGGLGRGLLGFYDRVITTDVDEFVLFAGPGTLAAHLARRGASVAAIAPVGLNMIPTPGDCAPEAAGSLLARHPHALVSAKYTKPCIAAQPVEYTVGGHGLVEGRFAIDPQLVLVHLHYVTPDYTERMAARADIVARARAANRASAQPAEMPDRHWINWARPDVIREKEFEIFQRARPLDISGGFGPAAAALARALTRAGKRWVVDPGPLNADPLRVVLPEELRSIL